MTSLKNSQYQTLWQLLVRSFKITYPGLKDKIINSLFWAVLNIIVCAFVLPSMGMDKNFGAFMVATMPISCAFFTSINSIYALLTDVSSDGSNLQYELTLPLPQWLAFAKYAFENTYQALCVSLLILPVGKLLLWNQFCLEHFSFLKFYFLLTIASLFFGFFSIFIASITKDMYSGLDNIWTRIVFPMWFLGGFQFSWKTVYQISPTLAYINLLNPLTYALEGGRAASLNPSQSLPYWLCIGALMLFTILFGYLGIQNLKKRLDCI
ncbi:MAG: ABC transporter permease [Candidatus Dependentiae bacterium]|nr:ABC transporter permease [Candidatus Dependentiae bacterium]